MAPIDGRQGENDVIVGNRQQLGLAIFEPSLRGGGLALRAVAIAAGIVGDAACAQSRSADVAAERGGAAGLDRRHDPRL